MEHDRVVRRRRNVHRFVDSPVTEEEVAQMVDLARRVPSAGFSQGVDFLALVGREETDGFWDAFMGPDMSDDDDRFDLRPAGAVVQVLADPRRYLERYGRPDKVRVTGRPEWGSDPGAWPVPWWYVDAGMAAVTVAHAAVARGYDTYLLGLHRHVEEIWERYGIPAQVLQAGTVVIGRRHPDDRPLGSPLANPRRPLAEQLHRTRW